VKDKATYQELKNQIAELEKQNEVLLANSKTDIKTLNEKEKDKLNLLIKNSNDIIVLLDAEANQLFISDVVKKITSYEAKELIGPLANIVHPDDLQMTNQAFAEILENKNKTVRLQFRHIHKEKGYIWLEAVGQNYLDSPLINAIIVNTRDISKQKNIEFELKQAKEQAEANEIQLRELNTTKDKLFSIIAHDLRSPFNSIIGLSELPLINTENDDKSETKKCCEIINSTAKNTLILLDNLLNWAKSQTKELSITPEKIMLSEAILEIIGLTKSQAKAKNISLHYSPANDIELYVNGSILKTILRNLVSNALKYTNFGGDITISVTSEQDPIEITIADNGVGISKEIIHKLFDISTNITTSGTANEGGSGLGLVLCKEFVEKLGGQIWVESEEGKGSEFKFTLPLCD